MTVDDCLRAMSVAGRAEFLLRAKDAVLVQAQPVFDYIDTEWCRGGGKEGDGVPLTFPNPRAPWASCILQGHMRTWVGHPPTPTIIFVHGRVQSYPDAAPEEAQSALGGTVHVFDAVRGPLYGYSLLIGHWRGTAEPLPHAEEEIDAVKQATLARTVSLFRTDDLTLDVVRMSRVETATGQRTPAPGGQVLCVRSPMFRDESSQRFWRDHAMGRSMPILLHLFSLLNCKNVRAQEAPVPPKLIKKHAKQGHATPFRSYRTLVIDTRAAGQHHAGRLTRPGDARIAQHIVRGHYKTFTADRPLLGRHVGTYWWPQVMRGAAQVGTIVKDYRVV